MLYWHFEHFRKLSCQQCAFACQITFAWLPMHWNSNNGSLTEATHVLEQCHFTWIQHVLIWHGEKQQHIPMLRCVKGHKHERTWHFLKMALVHGFPLSINNLHFYNSHFMAVTYNNKSKSRKKSLLLQYRSSFP